MHLLSPAHSDWPALVADARRWPAMRHVAEGQPEEELRLLLKAPVAIAWWIQTFAPELLLRDHLDLVIVGVPGGPSAADDGRPYQLLPLLLERPRMTVDATVVLWAPEATYSPRPAYSTSHLSLEALPGAVARPATIVDDSLSQLLERRQGKAPDLCLLIHPGFDERISLWVGLRELLASGAHVGSFARSMEKVERDAWLLRAHGYDVAPAAQQNPWSRYHPELRGHGSWGAVGWRVDPRSLPPRDYAVDVPRLHRAYDAQQFLQHEFEVWNPLQFIGRVQTSDGDTDPDPERFVGLPDHHAISLRTGELWALEPDERVRVDDIVLPPEVIATYPGEDAPAFERLLWAVDVYRDEVRRREAAALQARSAAQVEHFRTSLSLALKGTPSREEVDALTEYYRGGAAPGAVSPGSESLFRALRTGAWDEAAARVATTPSLVNAEDEDGMTPLFHALRSRHYELARRWLERGADPNHLDHEGFAVIHDLAKRDETEPVDLLQHYGADLDRGTGMGFTPALLALRYGCWNVLAYLLKQRVDLRRSAIAGTSVSDQYEQIDGLPRALRSVIEQQLGKRRVIPLTVMPPAVEALPPV
ncbi:MAG: ankyrin repeat domain-containing protein [Casimicrobiaceae bacterium]